MKKKILSLCLVVAMVATAIAGASMAYLTDTEEAVNVAVVGNVNVELNEKQRDENGTDLEDFEQGKTVTPIVGNITEKDDKGMPTNSNYVDKIVYATNTGKNDAYIRILVAIPTWANTSADTGANANNLHWNYPNDANMEKLQDAIGGEFSASSYNDWTLEYDGTLKTTIKIDDAEYVVFSFTMKDVVKAGESTPVVMNGFYLDSAVDYDADKGVYLDKNGNEIEGFDGTIYIPVYVEAVQADGFADANTALNTAFGEFTYTYNPWAETKVPAVVSTADELAEALAAGEDVVLTEDVTYQGSVCLYGVADTVVNGSTLNGNGQTLSVTMPEEANEDGHYDYTALSTTGGTIENLNIDNGFRAVFLENMTKDVYLKNMKIGGEGVCYAINTGANTGEYSLIVTDCQINGWTSFAQIKSASFTNCSFGQGGYYTDVIGRVVKPYVNTTFTDCSFIEHMNLDLSALGEGQKVVFENCTVNSQAVTADVFTVPTADEQYETALFTVDLPDDDRTLADCVIFK